MVNLHALAVVCNDPSPRERCLWRAVLHVAAIVRYAMMRAASMTYEYFIGPDGVFPSPLIAVLFTVAQL
ncbi:MAG: hypothetical protein NZ840_13785, partial [Anaerolineales bacterium]|nr:hypothetical protein [Anaerolineales bacterium]MDW8163105.1 hypothetical protein [Anaerolineales bacterium]